MKKRELKKSLKFQLNRETLRALEHPELERIAGGTPTALSCTCSANSRFTCCTNFC